MIAITEALHTHMLTVNGPQLPATYTGDGVVAVRSAATSVTYLVRFLATPYHTLVECPCGDFTFRSGPKNQPCKHALSAYVELAQMAMEAAKAA